MTCTNRPKLAAKHWVYFDAHGNLIRKNERLTQPSLRRQIADAEKVKLTKKGR